GARRRAGTAACRHARARGCPKEARRERDGNAGGASAPTGSRATRAGASRRGGREGQPLPMERATMLGAMLGAIARIQRLVGNQYHRERVRAPFEIATAILDGGSAVVVQQDAVVPQHAREQGRR